MAVLNLLGVNFTNLTASPPVLPPSAEYHGRKRTQSDKIVLAAQADAGSTFKVARLPEGARVLSASILYSGANIASLTTKAGTAADDDAFGAAGATATGEVWVKFGNSVGIINALTAETDIIFTTAGANVPSGRTIFFDIEYVTD